MYIRKYFEILGVMPLQGVLCETFGQGESGQMCFFPILSKTCFGRQTEKVVMWSGDLSLG